MLKKIVLATCLIAGAAPALQAQSHLDAIGAPGAWSQVKEYAPFDGTNTAPILGDSVSIAIVDDGVWMVHPGLSDNIDRARAWNWVGLPTPNANPNEFDDHGTACAGLAAGHIGVAPHAWIVAHRLLSTAAGQPGEIISANPLYDQNIGEALLRNMDIIDISSNSWGPADDGQTLLGPGPTTQVSLLRGVTEGRITPGDDKPKGLIYVWAAGDGANDADEFAPLKFTKDQGKTTRTPFEKLGDNSNKDGYANSIYTIAVGAVDVATTNPITMDRAHDSERGANLIVVAPSQDLGQTGVTTTTTMPVSGTGYRNDFTGTSAAAPQVSGVVALMLQANPRLHWRDVQEILIKTANSDETLLPDGEWMTNNAPDDGNGNAINGYRFNPNFGAGLVDADAAVSEAMHWKNMGPQISASKSTPRFATQQNITDPEDINWQAYEVNFDFLRNVDPRLRVEHATVSLELEHAYRGDLLIELISPSGTVSRLVEPSTDRNANYKNWTFSTVQFWGERNIVNEDGTIEGDGQNGRWTLRITDVSSKHIGYLLNATLTLWGTYPPETQGLALTYPGDANDDGIVDEMDFFFTASVLGTTGDRRQDQGIQFKPYTATNWNKTANFQGKLIDINRADANGDGLINLDDLSVTIIHRGKKR